MQVKVIAASGLQHRRDGFARHGSPILLQHRQDEPEKFAAREQGVARPDGLHRIHIDAFVNHSHYIVELLDLLLQALDGVTVLGDFAEPFSLLPGEF
jgi:hypothetical protein